MIDRILSLCDLFGPTGFEDEVREAIRAQAEPFADEILQDTAGNLLVSFSGMRTTRGF